jgi:hypothetical protein
MQLDHVTLQDDTLTHQVRFSSGYGGQKVSCNCRATTGEHSKSGKLYYDPMGVARDLIESRALYNDPDNHWAPFKEEDKATW